MRVFTGRTIQARRHKKGEIYASARMDRHLESEARAS